MTRIKLCGLRRPEDIQIANQLHPDYVGFVFAKKSRRYISSEDAAALRKQLSDDIPAVGVFVDEPIVSVVALLKGTIQLAQLHGHEDPAYIADLKTLTGGAPVIQAFRIRSEEDLIAAQNSPADFILLDAGAGDGVTFDWSLLHGFPRPYFLAGGLNPDNVSDAVSKLHPYAVDVSSGIETEGIKDPIKMTAFVKAVRERGTL